MTVMANPIKSLRLELADGTYLDAPIKTIKHFEALQRNMFPGPAMTEITITFEVPYIDFGVYAYDDVQYTIEQQNRLLQEPPKELPPKV